jgi:hypothetical protein
MTTDRLPNPEHDDAATVLRRIRNISIAAWVFAVFALISSGFRAFSD